MFSRGWRFDLGLGLNLGLTIQSFTWNSFEIVIKRGRFIKNLGGIILILIIIIVTCA